VIETLDRKPEHSVQCGFVGLDLARLVVDFR
jgi:hypothetical protein